MYTVLLVAHTIIILFLIGVILLQHPEGDGLSGLSGGGGNLFSGRTAGNVLTRTTAILATLFILSSLALAILGGHMNHSSFSDILAAPPPLDTENGKQGLTTTTPDKPLPAPASAAKPAAPVAPAMPSVPKPE